MGYASIHRPYVGNLHHWAVAALTSIGASIEEVIDRRAQAQNGVRLVRSIDRPLLITKEGVESVVPRETWRGQFHKGTSLVTGLVRDCAQGGQTGCLLIAWPGMQTNAAHSWGGEKPDIRVWYGGLVDGMRDASGQMYMRNRYYDPATGQFTQTDPIGLAGGLNAYGFAAGDPVSYSDPYGLRADTLKFNGTQLTLVGDDGKVKGQWAATSGRAGATAGDQDVSDFGPIPEGTYMVDPADIFNEQGLDKAIFRLRTHFADWGDYRTPLTRISGTAGVQRSRFWLHGGSIPGSAGCIDVGRNDAAVFGAIQGHAGNIPLIVQYSSPDLITAPARRPEAPHYWIK
ncbi:RHS repeat-associated core domain-containing protein [Longimicrobium sp.]|uniref:RHS repeat-associated core domain-containing protein n=1 Tax=Longimicrobium sp. TaxID=2029185 RepID=UPI002E303F99|nr:RHS repeat-associated core domain-containing protein [Longimicrobium sp.]HEX6037620.1 RHS repeat-associated core domain-containing protein [Longimicrobium sp.]